MRNKKLLLQIFIIFIAVSLFVIFLQKNRWYSQTDLIRHGNEGSCWTSVNGSVYDVTPLISTHSGGNKVILMICGKDATSMFNQRHGEEDLIKSEMENYKIGILR